VINAPAANLLHDTNAAEDVVQDVFISFLQSVANFQLRGSLKAYLSVCLPVESWVAIRVRF